MKETGIIMSGDHPLKVLDGRKTMTRRTRGLNKINESPGDWVCTGTDGLNWGFKNLYMEEQITIKSPYGGVGDLLWMKETWKIRDASEIVKLDDTEFIVYKAGGELEKLHGDICYNEYGKWLQVIWRAEETGAWQSSMHMPRVISRSEMLITGITPERVQQITEEDVKAEGVKPKFVGGITTLKYQDYYKYVPAFAELWDSLNLKRGHGWEHNDWVWAITFKKTGA